MVKKARWGMALVGVLGALGCTACANQTAVTTHAPVEERLPTNVEQPAAPAVLASSPPKGDEERTTVLKTWRSREEVEAARETEQQHARERETFWALRKDRESLRPTNIGPGGKCICVGGDPLCSCR